MIIPSAVSLRATYFFFFGSLGSLLPFLSILLSERGITPTDIGIIVMVLPASNLLFPPLWGILADATGSRLLILRIALLGSCGFLLLLIPHFTFWTTMAVMVGFGLFRSPLTSLLDAITHAHLEKRLGDFGRYRLWGSLGFLIAAAGFGHLRDTMSEAATLATTGALLLTCCLSTLLLKSTPLNAGATPRVFSEAIEYLRNPAIQRFAAGIAIYYLAHSVFDAYMGLHLKSLGYSDSFVGLAWAFGVAVEVAVMAFSRQIFQQFRPSTIMCLSALAAVVRWALLSVVTSQAGILLQQPLHALTFGMWYLGCAKWIQSRAPKHLRASLQSIMISSMGLGMLGGYLIGGRSYELYGGFFLFGASAVVAFVAFSLFVSLRKTELNLGS